MAGAAGLAGHVPVCGLSHVAGLGFPTAGRPQHWILPWWPGPPAHSHLASLMTQPGRSRIVISTMFGDCASRTCPGVLGAAETTHQRINARSAPHQRPGRVGLFRRAHRAQGVPACGCVEVKTDHRVCTAAARPRGHTGPPRKHLHRTSLSSCLGEVACS